MYFFFSLLPPALERRKLWCFSCLADSKGLSSHTDAVWHPQKDQPRSPLRNKCVIGALPAAITLHQLLHPQALARTWGRFFF